MFIVWNLIGIYSVQCTLYCTVTINISYLILYLKEYVTYAQCEQCDFFCIHLVCSTWAEGCYCKKSLKIFLIKYWASTWQDVRMIIPLFLGSFTLVGGSRRNLHRRWNVPYSDFNNTTPSLLEAKDWLNIWLITDKAMGSVCKLTVHTIQYIWQPFYNNGSRSFSSN